MAVAWEPNEGARQRPTFDTPDQLQVSSLREQAIAVIRNALVTGEVRPGETYSAAGLAQKLGVSSSPVREAMLTLVNEGILEPVRNRGFRVLPLTDRDIDDIYQLRKLLEPFGLAIVSENGMADKDLAQFRELAEALKQASRNREMYHFLDLDRQFHLGLLGLTGNRRLVEIVANLRDRTQLYGLAHLDTEELVESAREHATLLEAIASSNPERAAELMRHHLGHIRGIWAARGEAATSSGAS